MANVLLVDDERSIQFSFALILTDAGHTVFVAENQSDAMEILAAKAMDVALVDRLLGSHNGMDLIKFINKEHSLCTSILISAYPSFESASQKFKHRLFAYLEKPIKKKDLCKVVEYAVKNNREKHTKT